VLAALLPLVVLSAALGIASLRHQQQAIEDEALDHVQRISMLLERELSAQIDILRTLTNSALLDGPVDEAAFAELARRVRRDQSLWTALVLSDPEGTVSSTCRSPSPASQREGSSTRSATRERWKPGSR